METDPCLRRHRLLWLANPARRTNHPGRIAIRARPTRRRISAAARIGPNRRGRARSRPGRQLSASSTYPAPNLLRALNRTLPQSIRVLGAETVKSTFHARHSAVAKTYEYRVLPIEPACHQICPPFLARYVYSILLAARFHYSQWRRDFLPRRKRLSQFRLLLTRPVDPRRYHR